MIKIDYKYFFKQLKARKEGIVIGALSGLALGYYALSQGADLNTIASAGEGLLDNMLARNATAVQVATYKLYGVFATVGAAIGYYVDIFYDGLGFPGRKKRRAAPRRRVGKRKARRGRR